MVVTEKTKKSTQHKFTPGQIMVMGFSSVILIGAILLMLPISSNSGEWTNFIDCLFTSTSAVCVTGLVIFDTSMHWSIFGKTVLITLVQIGGVGFMSISVLIALLFGKKINLRERTLIKEALNQNEISGTVKLVKRVLKITFLIELLGAILLSFVFIPKYGIYYGIGYSVFHSISAFCNAGFDLLGRHTGEFSSLTAYYNNSIIVFTISALVILGGIGYPVMIDIGKNRKFSKLSLSAKLSLITTIALLVIGTILILVGEFNNSGTIGNMGFIDKFKVAFFQSMTTRTAGFGTLDFNQLKSSTLFIMIVLMFIGASPASTGGGIKTTTIAVIFLAVKSFLKNENEITIFKKKIDVMMFRKALGVFIIGLVIFISGTYIISITQGEKYGLMESAFEVSSALSTVGLSMAGSSNLNTFGKIFIALLMFAGRVGSLTVFASFTGAARINKVRYPEEKVLVG